MNGLELLPGRSVWGPYLEQSPVGLDALTQDPFAVLKSFLPASLAQLVRETLNGCASVLLFLLLTAVLATLLAEQLDHGLMELLAVSGCGMLVWKNLADFSSCFCEKLGGWQQFLMGFLPVYAGVLTMGGETAAGSSAGGFFLLALCGIAQLLTAFLPPVMECYLALTITCCISSEESLAGFCRTAGQLLSQGLLWAGKALLLLLGLQRVAALQLDRSTLRAGQLMLGAVPIVGQTLSDASETILAAVQLLKSGLGIAAVLFLAAEFVPFYLSILVRLLFLMGCELLCSFTGLGRCQRLMSCLEQAVRCMAAATVLFFGFSIFGTILLFGMGGG